MKQLTTQWISGSIKPTRPGVYERDNGDMTGTSYSLWDGTKWCVGRGTPWAASRMEHQPSYFQAHAWRGLLRRDK